MSQDRQNNRVGDLKSFLLRYMPTHMVVFGVTAALAAIIQSVAPVGFSLLKPMLIWAILLIVHFLYVRAINTDQAWADERTSNIILHATDLGHIDDIRQRYEEKERESSEVEPDDNGSEPGNGKPF